VSVLCKRVRMALVAALAVMALAEVSAQAPLGLTGTVVDESGGAVAGAQVAIASGPGAGQSTTTDANGGFRLTGIGAGAYVLQVSKVLFESTRVDVVIGAAAPAPLRITLRVSTLSENVTVTGTAATDKLSLDTPVATGSRLGLTAREIPASVTILERSLIEQRGATDTQEILKSVPGLTAAAPPGSAGTVTYRGFGAANVTQLFNGITVQYDAIAARPVDSWVYDRVEVVGGPSTFLFGAGAVGGSINYVTKVADRGRNLAQAQVRLGSFETIDANVGANRTFGSGRVRNTVRADVAQSRTAGYVDGSERTALSTAASWLIDVGPKFSQTLAVEYQNEQADRPYWGTPILTPTTGNGQILPGTRFANYNSADGIYEQTVGWARSLTEYRPNRATSFKNTVYFYDALRDYRNVEVYRFDTANALVSRSSPLLQRHDQRLFGNRFEGTYSGHLGRLPSDWAGGVDVSYNKQTRFPLSLSSTVSVVNPVTFTTENFFDIPGMVPGFTPDRTNEVTTLAFFVENRTKLTSAVHLVTALRRDQIDLEGTNLRPATISATNPAYFKNTYTPVTGRVGLMANLGPAANVYAQFSTAADPPAGILTTASFAQVRTFDLTTGRQVEAGTKFDFAGGRGSATAAVFQIERKNLAIADPLNPGTTIPVGQQSSRGIEVAGSYRPHRALVAQGNYAYVDAQFDDLTENVGGVAVSRNGNVPNNTPAHVTNLWLAYTATPKLEVGADGRWVSSRFGNTANTIGDEAYSLLGAYATYRFSPKLAVTGRARNLADEIYAASVTGTPMFFLGAPRSFDVTLRVGF